MPSTAANPNIQHVFVLMLENRSFDHMLGFSGLNGIDGASANETNTYKGQHFPASNDAANVMGHDPGHEFTDVLEQLCGAGTVYTGGAYPEINNSGFVSNYTFGDIMKCYNTPKALTVMMTLASEFAVCDHWYSSLPGPTWPNRFFVHAASSGGLDHSPTTLETLEWEKLKGFVFENGTIYESLVKTGKQWRIYRGVRKPLIGSIPSVAAFRGIQIRDTIAYEKFADDVKGNYPYAYTFIEPNYGDVVSGSYSGGQSQHPMDDIRHGELLIKKTYEAIRNSPLWPSSLLIITYDEHGGFYDHFPPPAAVAPGDTTPHSAYNKSGFGFDQYGVRVPAIVISAYTPKNIVSHLPFDHSSIPATLEQMFNMPALTKRDAAANTVGSLASLTKARPDIGEGAPPKFLSDPSVPLEIDEVLTAKPVPDSAPVDGGNLPGFLFVVRKEQLEKAEAAGIKPELVEALPVVIQTRGEAREYLETNLPELMKED